MALNPSFSGWQPQPDDPRDHIYVPPKAADHEKIDLANWDARLEDPYNQYFLGSCVANAVAAALRFGENSKYKIGWHANYQPSRLWLYWCGRLFTGVEDAVSRADAEKFLKFLSDTSAEEGTFPREAKAPIEYWRVRYDMMKDNGTYERDVIRAIAYLGVCSDNDWPYQQVEDHWKMFGGKDTKYSDENLSQWYCNNKDAYFAPKLECLQNAPRYTDGDLKFYRIRDLDEPRGGPHPSNTALVSDMEAAICEGFPVIVALRFASTPGFNNVTKDSPIFQPTGASDMKDISGHCVLCVGYNRKDKQFKFLNSWGKDWGQGGCFYVPYRFFEPSSGLFQTSDGTDYAFADDFWVIKTLNPQRHPS